MIIMNTLNLEMLPHTAQKELKDFYDFLVLKYKHASKSGTKKTRPCYLMI